MQKTKGDTFDLRAEEDAARRLNVGKAINNNSSFAGLKSRGKKTDLIGKALLKERVAAVAKDHGVTVDPEASLYLMAAIESRLRKLLVSSISAQTHRTQSSHLHTPPVHSRTGRAKWSHTITSDPAAVLDALNRANREEEQEFRKSRMTRLAREAEIQRIRDRQLEREREGDLVGPGGVGGGGEGGGGGSPSNPDFPMSSMSEAGPSTPISKPTPSYNSSGTPMFGALRESSTPKSSSKKSGSMKKANPRDVSAEVQHKMANATAMRSVGMGKKYGWMTGNVPTISSPLAGGGKKRKAEKEKNGSKLKDSLIASASNQDSDTDKGKDKEREKNDPSTPMSGSGAATTPEGDTSRPNKRPKHNISAPTRRLILVDNQYDPETQNHNQTQNLGLNRQGLGSGRERENEAEASNSIPVGSIIDGRNRRVEDDRAITMVDLVFALEHGGLGGNGKGREDDVLQKVWGRAGGPWGRDGWDGRK